MKQTSNAETTSSEDTSYQPSVSDLLLQHAQHTLEDSPLYGYHLFVRTFPLTSKKQFLRYYRACFEHSSLYLDSCKSEHSLDLFLQRLWDIEDSASSHCNKKAEHRYLYCTKIMIPLTFNIYQSKDASRIEAFVTALNHELFHTPDGDLPFFYAFTKLQTCTYIMLFHTERYYYPEGIIKQTVQASDVYRKKSNGHMCKADDPEAVLAIPKGTVTGEKLVYFTKKHRIFNYSNRHQKMVLRNKIKEVLVSHLYKVDYDCFASKKHTGTLQPLFGRISYDRLKRTDLILKHIEWNKVLINCEEQMYNFIQQLSAGGFYNDFKDKISSFIAVWRMKLLEKDFKIPTSGRKKVDLHIKFNEDFDEFYADMHEGVEFVFLHAFEHLKQSIYSKINSEYAFCY